MVCDECHETVALTTSHVIVAGHAGRRGVNCWLVATSKSSEAAKNKTATQWFVKRVLNEPFSSQLSKKAAVSSKTCYFGTSRENCNCYYNFEIMLLLLI